MTALQPVVTSPLDRVLDALRARGGPVRKVGREWIALCPAHDDHHPSLNLGEGRDGALLVVCRSQQCAYADVMGALGLDPRDGFTDGDRQPAWSPQALRRHTYRDPAGNVLGWAERQRGGPPKFLPRALDGSLGSSPQLRATLYNAGALRDDPAAEVVLCEGEQDADAWTLHVGTPAVTNSNGAASFTEVHARQLAGRTVQVVLDRDGPGRKRLDKLREAGLWRHATVVGVYEPPPPYKDLAEHLAAGLKVEQLVAVPVPEPDVSADDPPAPDANPPNDDPFAAAVDKLRSELLSRDALADLPEADPLIPGVLNRLTYSLLVGRDGTYKTFMALSWCLSLATGTPWQGRPVDTARVLYLIGEGAYDFDHRVAAWEREAGVRVPPGAFVTLPRVPNLFRGHELVILLELIRSEGFGLVVVDTLRRASTGADANGSDMAGVVDALEEIKRATADGAVLVLAHTDKADNDSRGFSGIEDDADTVWHARRDQDAGTLQLVNRKMRAGPSGARITFAVRQVGASVVLDQLSESGPAHRPTGPRLSPSARKVLDVLRRPGYEDGATAADVMTTAQVTKQRLAEAVTELMSAGLVTRTGARGQYVYRANPSPDRVPS